MGKYFTKRKPCSTNITLSVGDTKEDVTVVDKLGNPLNLLVNLFKIKYTNYYGSECHIPDTKLKFELKQSFDILHLDVNDESDREWYTVNLLEVLFERYDTLNYSRGKPLGAGHLHVEWLIKNIIDNVPNVTEESTSIKAERPTNDLVALFKSLYEGYYNKPCSIPDHVLHAEFNLSFQLFHLDITDSDNKSWYVDNILKVIFERYDTLNYSRGKPLGAGHLHVKWLLDNILSNVPNPYKSSQESLVGKVGTAEIPEQFWERELKESINLDDDDEVVY